LILVVNGLKGETATMPHI